MKDQQVSTEGKYHRIGLISDLKSEQIQPDTTAIILNWSRFPNVKRIATLICSQSLDTIIAEVFIWNNSPNKITYDDFRDTGCPAEKLRIYNSPKNLYFQARFMACREAKTPYCFIQDDDYLVVPEVIHALHAELSTAGAPRTIHLLPAHEHLSTSLREIHATTGPGAALPAVHTGFAWLGHGAMLHRSEAVGFLELMRALDATEAEMEMADNYYTILGNRVPEVWFDQGIELGGGQPFTVGAEGEERNNTHIARAADYLTAVAAGAFAGSRLPYVSYGWRGFDTSATRAVCRETRCLLETNIALLPPGLTHVAESAREVLAIEAHNRDVLGAAGTQRYVNHPPSRGVDGGLETFFLSPYNAKAGDFISLDFFDDVRILGSWATIEMAWVVDANTEHILRACALESSLDGLSWRPVEHKLTCQGIVMDGTQRALLDATHQSSLRDCAYQISLDPACTDGSVSGARYFRVKCALDQDFAWRVHDVYMRGLVAESAHVNS